jgi:hypothetical protein
MGAAMAEERKNGNGKMIALLGALASLTFATFGIGSYVVAIAGDNADTKRRIANLEKRQDEDRQNVYKEQREIGRKLEQVDTKINDVNRTLGRIESALERRDSARR